jgi:hypothetical protein
MMPCSIRGEVCPEAAALAGLSASPLTRTMEVVDFVRLKLVSTLAQPWT